MSWIVAGAGIAVLTALSISMLKLAHSQRHCPGTSHASANHDANRSLSAPTHAANQETIARDPQLSSTNLAHQTHGSIETHASSTSWHDANQPQNPRTDSDTDKDNTICMCDACAQRRDALLVRMYAVALFTLCVSAIALLEAESQATHAQYLPWAVLATAGTLSLVLGYHIAPEGSALVDHELREMQAQSHSANSAQQTTGTQQSP